jgi:hypothetical protein
MEYLTSEVRDNTLVLGFKEGTNVSPTKGIRYNLKVKNLNEVSVAGSGNIHMTTFDADSLTLSISGSGDATITDLTANGLRIQSSGSGNFDLSGSTTKADVNISGSGKYRAPNLETDDTSITIGGSGSATVWANVSLNVQISGSGEIDYYGEPKVSQSISGSGRSTASAANNIGCELKIRLAQARRFSLRNHYYDKIWGGGFTGMTLPQSLLADLDRIPRDRPVVLLMRHAHRFPITDPASNYQVGLTEEGVQTAEAFGRLLARLIRPGRVMSSPVGRCVDTASAIARGAGWPVEVVSHHLLSHDHIAPAWSLAELGRCAGDAPAEVMATLALLLEHERGEAVLDVMVTHDTIVGAIAGCLLRAPILGDELAALPGRHLFLGG